MKILLFHGTCRRNRQAFARVAVNNVKFEYFAWKYHHASKTLTFSLSVCRLLANDPETPETHLLGFYWKFSFLIEHALTLEEGHASDTRLSSTGWNGETRNQHTFLQVKSILAERLKARADNARELGGLIAIRYPSFFLSLSLPLSATFPLCTIREWNTVAAMFRYFFHFATSKRCSFYGEWIWYCLEERAEIGADEGKRRFDKETYNAWSFKRKIKVSNELERNNDNGNTYVAISERKRKIVRCC